MNPYLKKPLRYIFSVYGYLSNIPFICDKSQVAPPEKVGHSKWVGYLASEFNKPGLRVLEVGSRNVTGANFRHMFDKAYYTGFDYYSGENVDVVGDAHNLRDYFPGKKFDLIFSSAVFEHLYMPWIVAEEMASLLDVGGHVFVETHFSFCAHERPWNFFQFSDMGLRCLFNKRLGFEVVDCGMSNPINGYFSQRSDPHLRFRPVNELYCHSEILCKKVSNNEDFNWRSCIADDIVGETHYPQPSV